METEAPIKCPNCGSTEIEEICDGVWEKRYFQWKDGKYIQTHLKSDSNGDSWIQCAECETGYTREQQEKFLETVVYDHELEVNALPPEDTEEGTEPSTTV